MVFGIAVVPVVRGDLDRERMAAIAQRFGSLQAVIFLVSLAIVWVGLELLTATVSVQNSPELFEGTL